MKKIFGYIAVIAISFSIFTTIPANEQLSCDDLAEVSEALDTVSAVVDEADEADLNNEDAISGLVDVIKGLQQIQAVEKDPALGKAIKAILAADSKDEFVDGIDAATNAIDALEEKDC